LSPNLQASTIQVPDEGQITKKEEEEGWHEHVPKACTLTDASPKQPTTQGGL